VVAKNGTLAKYVKGSRIIQIGLRQRLCHNLGRLRIGLQREDTSGVEQVDTVQQVACHGPHAQV